MLPVQNASHASTRSSVLHHSNAVFQTSDSGANGLWLAAVRPTAVCIDANQSCHLLLKCGVLYRRAAAAHTGANAAKERHALEAEQGRGGAPLRLSCVLKGRAAVAQPGAALTCRHWCQPAHGLGAAGLQAGAATMTCAP